MIQPRYIVGIDEAGRGPLAGPVAVGVFCVKEHVLPLLKVEKLTDSKKLPVHKRREWFAYLKEQKDLGNVRYVVSFSSASIVDRYGISYATRSALDRSLYRLKLNPKACDVYLDGGLRAPRPYHSQQTVTKGDERIPVISFASIVAKEIRDQKMERLSKTYPQYNFGQHKGYGTKLHYKLLKRYGLSVVHRKTFLSTFVM